jgi:hypothetical protein
MFKKNEDAGENFEFCFLVLVFFRRKACPVSMFYAARLATAVPSSLVSLLPKIFLARGTQLLLLKGESSGCHQGRNFTKSGQFD